MSAPQKPQEEGRERRTVGGGQRVLLRIVPDDVHRFVESLRSRLVAQPSREDELSQRIQELSNKIDTLATELVKPFTTKSAVIVPPTTYEKIAQSRLSVLVSEANNIIQRLAGDVDNEFDEALSGRMIDFEKFKSALNKLESLVEYTLLIHVALIEASNRLAGIIASNAPARIRPPLVNAQMGFDLVE